MSNANKYHASKTTTATVRPSQKKYIKQEPYVNDEGIWLPVQEYVPEGYAAAYQCLITKELFVEAYNKWIKNKEENNYGESEIL